MPQFWPKFWTFPILSAVRTANSNWGICSKHCDTYAPGRMPQVEFASGTPESTAKFRSLGKSRGMCSKCRSTDICMAGCCYIYIVSCRSGPASKPPSWQVPRSVVDEALAAAVILEEWGIFSRIAWMCIQPLTPICMVRYGLVKWQLNLALSSYSFYEAQDHNASSCRCPVSDASQKCMSLSCAINFFKS